MSPNIITHSLVALCLLAAPLAVGGLAADRSAPDRLNVYPETVNLTTSRDRQSLVVQAVWQDGITRDVTGKAKFDVASGKLVERSGAVLRPAANGKTKLTVTYAGKSRDVPVRVAKAEKERPISFRLDVMPVFTKAGCNTGSCHGASRGKDGFKLSLFGFDPAGDYYRLTRQMPGRRVNLAQPERSLVLMKATGQVQHTGGERFTRDSKLYETLLRWLRAGAPDDGDDAAEVTGIEVYPKQMVLKGKGATQRLTVRATYSDGTDRDVTDLASFITNNDNAAPIDQNGVVTAKKRGEAFLIARFDEYTEGVPAIVLPGKVNYEEPDWPARNYIDELVFDKLRKLRVEPSQVCSDRAFLRRAYIDIIGKLPPPQKFRSFVASDAPNKRADLVDELLGRKEFVEMWVMKLAELLQIRSSNNGAQGISYKSTILYYNWLKEQIANDVPMDEIAKKLLSSSGSTFRNPPTNFYQVERDNKKLAENVAQVFMGMRIQCAQCHNHPFDKWTMDDYYGFVAFFTQVGRKRAGDQRARIIFDKNGGEAKHPVDGRVMKPRFLGGRKPEIGGGEDRREVLAEWIASPDNPYFARNLANRVWAHFFGRGIVEPVDDVRISNPPSNGPLLTKLAEKFTDYDYDFKKLVRDICTSRTYQLASTTNATNRRDSSNFSHAYLRRVRAEVLYDMICQATGTAEGNDFKGLPKGARAVQIPDGKTTNYFLKTFGRASRETVCSCEVSTEPNLSQALHLMNGPTVHNRIRRGKLVRGMLDNGKNPKKVIERLYVRCLTREPTERETKTLLKTVKSADDRAKALRDVFWAILNSKEFMFNH